MKKNINLTMAIISDNTVALKKAIKDGEDINAKGSSGTPPYILAHLFERYEAIQVLVDAGADVNATDDLENDAKVYEALLNNNTENIYKNVF